MIELVKLMRLLSVFGPEATSILLAGSLTLVCLVAKDLVAPIDGKGVAPKVIQITKRP